MKKILLVHETFGRLAGAEQNILVTVPSLRNDFEVACLYGQRSGKDEAAFEALFPASFQVDFNGEPETVRQATEHVLAQVNPDAIYVLSLIHI